MAAVGILTVLSAIFGLAVAILWLVIGWRAMRAHEDLAQTHFELKREMRHLADTLAGHAEKTKASDPDPTKLPRLKD